MTLRKIHIQLLLLFLLLAIPARGEIQVQAKLDSVYIEMGRITNLQLTVTQPKGVKGAFPLLSQLRDNGIVPVCGDSIELRAPSKIDTVENDGHLTIKYDVPLQAFDSGYYHLPEFLFIAGNDSAASKRLSLKVIPVKAEADTPINDYASVSKPANPSWFDWVPDWIIDFWWVVLLALLAIGAFLYALRKYRKDGYLIPKKPEPTPYEVAIRDLTDLKSEKLWEQGMEREYYTELTEILRRYLSGRFGINAMEMTSRQILQALGKNKEISDKKMPFRQILDMADFVKFAKVRPLPEDNVKSFDNAWQFVKDTKPVPPPEEETPAKGKKGKNNMKGAKKANARKAAKKGGGK